MAVEAWSHPALEDARDLLRWQPPLGVLSVYLRIDPGDRGDGWRTELRNGLARVIDGAEGSEHEMRVALRSTADRVAERLSDREQLALPRGEVGFVEVARKGGVERWWSTHLEPRPGTSTHLAGRPVVAPFLSLAARGRPRGIALVSSERVRLLEWMPGHLEELWDWRPDPARAQGPANEGRRHYQERVAENRHRFLGECGGRAARSAADREWDEVIAFSSAQQSGHFRKGFDSAAAELVIGAEVDLIAEATGRLLGPVEAAIERRDPERERSLVERVLGAAREGGRGIAGGEGTGAALEEGRVEHLVIDDAMAAASEELVAGALATGAAISPVSGDAAGLLAPTGVAALLRY
ncbi:MAG TPA: hypothetical protein VIT85_08280 [Solirubrobacterales bacterium]